jgi:hypothetical protein
MKISAFLGASALTVAGAQAGTFFGTLSNQNVFGSSYDISIYRVATDLSSQGLTPASGRVEPEGMTWYNGNLYVASDGTAAEANGYLAVYAGGNLGAAPSAQRFTVTVGSNTAAYGPEGLTVNTRGSGYGSFSGSAPRFTAIDNVTSPVSSRVLGVMNTANRIVEDAQVNSSYNLDDIAYVPGATAADDRFAVIDGTGAIPTLRYLTTDAVPTFTGPTITLIPNAKGMTFLAAADAALFSPLATTDCLLISAGGTGVNFLRLYTTGGTLLAESTITAALGTPGIGEIEALAFDPATKRLFLGYENSVNSQIGVFTVPAPGAALGLALVGLAGRRRR